MPEGDITVFGRRNDLTPIDGNLGGLLYNLTPTWWFDLSHDAAGGGGGAFPRPWLMA